MMEDFSLQWHPNWQIIKDNIETSALYYSFYCSKQGIERSPKRNMNERSVCYELNTKWVCWVQYPVPVSKEMYKIEGPCQYFLIFSNISNFQYFHISE